MNGFKQRLTDPIGRARDSLHAVIAAGLDGGLQILQIREAGPAVFQVTLQFAAVLNGQLAVEIFGESSEDLFAVWVRHGLSCSGAH
jgi:hypothetical protein